jgi:hypothetical protein
MSAIRTSKNLRFATGRKKDSSLFLDCFRHVIIHKQYWNKWISDQCWINLINDRFEIPESLQFTKTNLNTALSRNKMYDGIDILTAANALGLYKSSYRPGKIRITGYYLTTPNVRPSEMPGGNSKWYEKLESEQPHTVGTRNIPVKRSLPEGSTPATMPSSNQKKGRRDTRSCVPNNNVIDFIDLTRNHVPRNDNSGLF